MTAGFVYVKESMPMGASEKCPLNGAFWTSVWRVGDRLYAYEVISDTFWTFMGIWWQQDRC